MANYNSLKQIVIAGPKEDIARAQVVFEKAGAQLYAPLNVSGAFHSRYMAAAAEEYKKFIDTMDFQELKFPVISNVTGRPFVREEIKNLLVRQMCEPVQWFESIRYLVERGEMEFVEIGHARVLSRQVKRIQKEIVQADD